MPSRYNRSLRPGITIAFACFYVLFAAGLSSGGAHQRPGSPCHGHDMAVSEFSDSRDIAAHGRSDGPSTHSDDHAADHAASACQFCSAIVGDTASTAPRRIVISAVFQDSGSRFFGQPPTPLSRPPQSFIAL